MKFIKFSSGRKRCSIRDDKRAATSSSAYGNPQRDAVSATLPVHDLHLHLRSKGPRTVELNKTIAVHALSVLYPQQQQTWGQPGCRRAAAARQLIMLPPARAPPLTAPPWLELPQPGAPGAWERQQAWPAGRSTDEVGLGRHCGTLALRLLPAVWPADPHPHDAPGVLAYTLCSCMVH